jgi:anhydro-N-acetylmuramic acid kinase
VDSIAVSDAERPLVALGLMSGTSADGIDAALLRLDGRSALEAARGAVHVHVPYQPWQREAVQALFDTPRATADVVCRMNFAIGEWFADAATRAIAAAGLRPEAVDVIGSHGQTIFHEPPGSANPGPGALPFPQSGAATAIETGSTLQIGEPAVIAERTGVTTVADFRVRDVAAGGQGAPLVSYVDALLFGSTAETRVVLNLGGIANATLLPPTRVPDASGASGVSLGSPVAFDTGPGNMVLDWLAAAVSGGALEYDVDGRLAATGRADERLLAELLTDPYFAAPPPKTTGRERFGAPYARTLLGRARARGLSDADTLATATALTAASVAAALRAAAPPAWPVREVVAGGGGTRNPTLMADIARRLPGVRVTTHEAYGISSQAKEAASFALLAAAAVRGLPNTLPSCTGAQHAVVMGKIVPGANFVPLMARLHGAAHSAGVRS